MQEGTTTTITKVTNVLKVLIIGTLVVLASRVPFLHKNHEFVDSIYSTEYKSHKAKYKPIINNRDTSLESLLVEFEASVISKEKYITQVRIVQKESVIALKEFNNKRKELVSSYKYNGFNAYFLFLLNIGTPILAFIICLFLIYTIFNPITSKTKKIVFAIYSSVFLFSSSYLILHSLLANRVYSGDFPEHWYLNIMKYTPVIIALTIPLLFYHFQTIEEKLKGIIAQFFNVIYKEIPNNEFIKPEKEKEYRNLRIKITDKIVGNE